MIAVYVNEEGVSASINEKGCIKLYNKVNDVWEVFCEIPFDLESSREIAKARRAMIEMVHKLEGCKAFVAKEVIGQLYYVLEANKFEAFEADGQPQEFLDSIQEAISTVKDEKTEAILSDPVTYFEKTEREGYYFLDLKKALNLDCSLSSKKLLLPFLHKKEFKSLVISCDHLPRWFETELKILDLKTEITKLNQNEYKVSVMI